MDASCGFRTPHLGLSPDPGLAVRELHDLTRALAIDNPTRDQIAVIKCRVPRYLVDLAADDPDMVWAIVQTELRDGVEKKWHEALPVDNEHWKRRAGAPVIVGRQATGTGGGIQTPTPSPTPTDEPGYTIGGGGGSSSRTRRFPPRAIAGTVVGVIALLAIIIAVILLVLRNRKKKRNEAIGVPVPGPTPPTGGMQSSYGGAPPMAQYQGKPELDSGAVYPPSNQPKPPAAAHIKPELEGTNQYETQYGAVNRPELHGAAGSYTFKPPEHHAQQQAQQQQQQQYNELPTNPPIPQPYHTAPQRYELDPHAHAQPYIPIPHTSSTPTTPATSTTAYSPHPPASTNSAYPPPAPSTQSSAPWPPTSRPFSPSQTAVSIGLPSSASHEIVPPPASPPPQLPTPPAVQGTRASEEIAGLETEARKIAEEIAEGERLQALRRQQAEVEARLREARGRGQ